MKSKYEEEIYQFFIQPENFEAMVKVVSHSEKVFEKLIREFWDSLKESLQKSFQDIDGGWEVNYSQDYSEVYCKLWIYHNTWCIEKSKPLISIAFENLYIDHNPYVGIHIDDVQEMYDAGMLKKQIEQLSEIQFKKTDKSSSWANWDYLSFNLSTYEDLIILLPSNRETVIKNLISQVKEVSELLIPEAEGIIRRSKLSD